MRVLFCKLETKETLKYKGNDLNIHPKGNQC